MRRQERCAVTGVEKIGPYTLLRVSRGTLDPGIPGQFFMLEAPGRVLPRPMSLCQAPSGELAFLLEAVGPDSVLAEVDPGDELSVFGPLGNGYRLGVDRPLLVGGGIGVAPFPYLSEQLGGPPAILGFRSDWHAQAAELLPNAEVVVEPTFVTEPLAELAGSRGACLRVGPSRCWSRSGSSLRMRSWRGRTRWPAATAPATAARVKIDGHPAPLRGGSRPQ